MEKNFIKVLEDCTVIDGVYFSNDTTFCADIALEDLKCCENQEERIKLAKVRISNLKKTVDDFKERMKREPHNYDIEIWILERYDELAVYNHYLKNCLNN